MSSKTHIAQTLLSRAHSPDTTETLFTERIKQKPLHLRPTSPTPSDNRSRRRLHRLRQKEYFLRHQKPKPLSAREKRESGIYKLPKEECKYEIFKGLNGMWGSYMREMLDLGPGGMGWRVQQVQSQQGKDKDKEGGKGPTPTLVSALSHGSKLVSADFHGAEMEIVRSRCAGRVGVKGIVVRDTKFTFVVVTEGDEVKTIPKEQTIFRFCLPLPDAEKDGADEAKEQGEEKKLVFELHGSQFQNRPVDRANKKFKWRNVDYL
ncbi:RNase P/RNase MRP complex subunit [Aspergillus stella-maris]|uniref:RNase P/RNase MRP complex subunit n=1 Tax=Aspergillus stella-maris TaxID=1810926 RepID=UPI003CCE208A